MINVDTDMIIPKQFLKTIKRSGLGSSLFFEMRYDDGGGERPDFILNREPWRGAQILVAGQNFGCGSSREHAPWALLDFGIRAIVAPSFADIFYNNCFKNGILPVVLPHEQVDRLMAAAEARRERSPSICRRRRCGLPAGDRLELRCRSVPQALSRQRSRRYRPDAGEGRSNRRLRGTAEDRRTLALRLIQPIRSGCIPPAAHKRGASCRRRNGCWSSPATASARR